MRINVLGTEYEVAFRDYDELGIFEDKGWDAYTDAINKKIVIGNVKTFPGYEKETDEYCTACEKETLRQEIIHAFLNESGLQSSAMNPSGSWAKNEEMVDWIALQFPKLLEAFGTAGCI